jgi:hypothetical protein
MAIFPHTPHDESLAFCTLNVTAMGVGTSRISHAFGLETHHIEVRAVLGFEVVAI